MTDFIHEPAMVGEVVEILSAVPSGLAVDCTVGAGGHARMLLDARPDLDLLGLDRDEAALTASQRALAGHRERVTLVHAGFERLDEVVREEMGATAETKREHAAVVAVLFDLGVSSPQLDDASRGFSYQYDAPLDMRMDAGQVRSAYDLVNEADERALTDIIRRYGEERHARAIARRIVAARPVRTTGELVDLVKSAIPARARRTGRHPARRTFQALRIAVNDELVNLERGLDAAFDVLAPRGRIVVISYHSLEDRIVKRRFQHWASGGMHPPGLPVPTTERGGVVRLLTRRPIRPSADELRRNPRVGSARLRAVERLEEAA